MRVPQRIATKGGLKWIQRVIADDPDILNREFLSAGAIKAGGQEASAWSVMGCGGCAAGGGAGRLVRLSRVHRCR